MLEFTIWVVSEVQLSRNSKYGFVRALVCVFTEESYQTQPPGKELNWT